MQTIFCVVTTYGCDGSRENTRKDCQPKLTVFLLLFKTIEKCNANVKNDEIVDWSMVYYTLEKVRRNYLEDNSILEIYRSTVELERDALRRDSDKGIRIHNNRPFSGTDITRKTKRSK